MSTNQTSLYLIRGNMTDEMLIKILKKELPSALQRMNISQSLSNAALDDLAYYLADYAKSCNKTDNIRELKDIQLNSNPTPDQCHDLKEFLDQVVRIKIVSKDYKVNNHLVKTYIGKIWSYIAPNVDKNWEKEEQRYGSGGGGTRG
jgi:aminoglycoside phosphotransferase family enzyme